MLMRDILYKDLVSVSENTKIRTLLRLFIHNRISVVPVVNSNDEYISCISEKDIMNKAIPTYMKSFQDVSFLPNIDMLKDRVSAILDNTVKEVMPDNYPTAGLHDTATYVADLMNKTGIREIPIVEDGMLIGKVHRVDILASCLK